MQGAAVAMPGRYAREIAIIEETGWGWQQIEEAPADLLEEILTRRRARLHWQAVRASVDKQLAE